MKRNGYTLVELLGVLAVMVVMLLIMVPAVTTTMKNADNQKYERYKQTIIDAAELYVETNSHLFPSYNTCRQILPLIEEGHLKKDLTNPLTNEKISDNDYYCINVGENGIKEYTVVEDAKNIGEITDDLLSNNETYTYMNGTYLKGKPTNNYVWYNGFIWRIMGKNQDGSIRLITEENITAIPWGAENSAQDYNNSYVKDWANTYFINHLKDTSGIVNSKFCEDSTLVTSDTSARTTCSNMVSAQAGLISLDEYNLAGGMDSYLVNGQFYWTLTPYSASNVWVVYGDGYLGSDVPDTSGIRAVISVDSNTIIIGGNGTLMANADTEYVLGQTLDEVSGKLKDNGGSGEYVTFDGKIYRIVEYTSNGTKLILDGFHIDSNGEYITNAYGTKNVDINEMFSTMETLLTGDALLTWLAPTRSNEIVNTTWYRGEYFEYNQDYKKIFANKTNGFESKIGLIHIGEMLSSQSLSIISKNYSVLSLMDNTSIYWTLTPYSASYAWRVNAAGDASRDSVTRAYSVRPVIVLSSDITISGGNGTLSNPYQV